MFSIFTYVMSRVTHSEPGLPMITAQALKLALFFFLVETKMESGQKKIQLERINSSKLASFAGGWRLLSNFRRIMTAKLRQLKFE